MPVKPTHPAVSGPSVPPADPSSSAAPAASADALIPAEHLWPGRHSAVRIRTEIPGRGRVRCVRRRRLFSARDAGSVAASRPCAAVWRGRGCTMSMATRLSTGWRASAWLRLAMDIPRWRRPLRCKPASLPSAALRPHRASRCWSTWPPSRRILDCVARSFFRRGWGRRERAASGSLLHRPRRRPGFWGGFHGKTAGVLGLMGSEFKQVWDRCRRGRSPVCRLRALSVWAVADRLWSALRRLCRADAAYAVIERPGRHPRRAGARDSWQHRAAAGLAAGPSRIWRGVTARC